METRMRLGLLRGGGSSLRVVADVEWRISREADRRLLPTPCQEIRDDGYAESRHEHNAIRSSPTPDAPPHVTVDRTFLTSQTLAGILHPSGRSQYHIARFVRQLTNDHLHCTSPITAPLSHALSSYALMRPREGGRGDNEQQQKTPVTVHAFLRRLVSIVVVNGRTPPTSKQASKQAGKQAVESSRVESSRVDG